MQVIYRPTGKALEYSTLAANLYRGCAHGCLYCYAPKIVRMTKAAFHANPQPRKDVLKHFETDCRKMAERNDTTPVLLSFTTDPYQPIEKEHSLTRKAIKIAHEHGICVEILTKGALRAVRDFDFLGKKDAFAVTLTFDNSDESEEWEPKASIPGLRWLALREAHSRGIRTWVSCEPVIKPEQTLRLIEESASYVDFYKVGRWNYDPRAEQIDWHDFGHRAVELLEKLGKKYLIKQDLAKMMNA